MRIQYQDWREDPDGLARELGISREAVDVYHESEVIDLHVDSFIWKRIFDYDLRKRHGHGLFGARFYSQVDFPRILEAGLTGACWVITTNPFRPQKNREKTFKKNLAHIQDIFAEVSEPSLIEEPSGAWRFSRWRAAGSPPSTS